MKIYTYEKHEGNFIFKSNKQNKAFKNSRLITKDIEFNANILFSNDWTNKIKMKNWCSISQWIVYCKIRIKWKIIEIVL